MIVLSPEHFSGLIRNLRAALDTFDVRVPDQGDDNDPSYVFRLLMLLDAFTVCARMEVTPHCTPETIVRRKQDIQPYLELLPDQADPHVLVAAERAHEAAMLVAPCAEAAPGSPAAVGAVTLSAVADLFTATMLDDFAAAEGMLLTMGGEPLVVPARVRLLMDAREKAGAVHARLTEVLAEHHSGALPPSALSTAGCGSCSRA